MLEIEYKGANAVVISTKKTRITVDPKLGHVGLNDLNTKDAIELGTEDRFLVKNPNAHLVLEGPGEYGVADVDIRGIAARRHIDSEGLQSTIYRIEVGDIRIGVLGNIDKKLSDDQLESLGIIDVLILPVGGGGYTLDGVDAASLVRTIEANVIIPVHFADTSIKYEVPQDLVDSFVSELGATHEKVAKMKFKNSAALPQALTVFELERS
jgi:L-ascorbate metabolism protein UlaG (beta-lactamase superfamily)